MVHVPLDAVEACNIIVNTSLSMLSMVVLHARLMMRCSSRNCVTSILARVTQQVKQVAPRCQWLTVVVPKPSLLTTTSPQCQLSLPDQSQPAVALVAQQPLPSSPPLSWPRRQLLPQLMNSQLRVRLLVNARVVHLTWFQWVLVTLNSWVLMVTIVLHGPHVIQMLLPLRPVVTQPSSISAKVTRTTRPRLCALRLPVSSQLQT